MTVRVRYPGRVCLLGEHCDWAGGASLAVPLPLGIDLRAERATEGLAVDALLEGELRSRRWALPPVEPGGGPLAFVPAAAAVLAARGIPLVPTHLHISGDLPAGRGFSSSAAVILATLDGLSRMAGAVLDSATLAELAYQVEHDRLGVACGRLDPLCCATAVPLYIGWHWPPPSRRPPATVPSAGPTAVPRALEPGGPFHLVAACFPRPRDTARILSTLQQAWRSDLRDALQSAQARRVCTALTTFAGEAAVGARAVMAGDAATLGRAMDAAQTAYEDELADGFAALRAPALWRTCQALRSHGALGAKFSGAGGDGSVIALFADEPAARAAVDMLEHEGLLAWYCPFGPGTSC